MVIGVTGLYCAGKNTFTTCLEFEGFASIDVDGLGHAALEAEKDQITTRFGDRILDEQGQIDRKKLGRIVFASKTDLRALEAIVHPAMTGETLRLIAANTCDWVINAAVLFRMGLHTACDAVACVRAPLGVIVTRARERDGLGTRDTLRRLAAQRGICGGCFPKLRGYKVDIVTIRNSGPPEGLAVQARGMVERLKRR